MRDYQKEHDDLTRRYYQEGNPDRLSKADFLVQHDLIWIDLARDSGGLCEDDYNDAIVNLQERACKINQGGTDDGQ